MLIIINLIGLDDQRIIIFGGDESRGTPGEGKATAPKDPLCVLDTLTLGWYIPKVSGKIPSNRRYHTANIVGKYMVISFGIYYIYFFCLNYLNELLII